MLFPSVLMGDGYTYRYMYTYRYQRWVYIIFVGTQKKLCWKKKRIFILLGIVFWQFLVWKTLGTPKKLFRWKTQFSIKTWSWKIGRFRLVIVLYLKKGKLLLKITSANLIAFCNFSKCQNKYIKPFNAIFTF